METKFNRSRRPWTPPRTLLLALVVTLTVFALPATAAVDDCDGLGGLEQLVSDSLRDYSQSQFDTANDGTFPDLKIILDSLDGLSTIPSTLPTVLTDAAQRLEMAVCRDGGDLLYLYPTAGVKSGRPPVSLIWRVGDIVIPGDAATGTNPVDPLFFQAPHFKEAEPFAVRLMRETRAKVMLLAANEHGDPLPQYMNAARPGKHVFLDMMQDIFEKYPQAAVIVLHGMGRDPEAPSGITSGTIQPGDKGFVMRARLLFDVPSFNDMLARGMGQALQSVPADFPTVPVESRLEEELRAPNGSAFGLGDLTKFYWAVNTSKINGFSKEHVRRIQGVHFETPTTFRRETISGEPNPYLEGNQRVMVRGINTAIDEYKQSAAFASTAEPDYCTSTCRLSFFRTQGIRLFSQSGFADREWVLPITGQDGQLYDMSGIDAIGSIQFPGGWGGEITLHANADGTGASETYDASDSNTSASAFANGAASATVDQPLVFLPAPPVDLEAEDYDNKDGNLSVETKSTGVTNLGSIQDGDWAKFKDVDLTGLNTFTAQIATSSSTSFGRIAVHVDDRDSLPVAILTGVSGPGGWSNFGPASAPFEYEVFGVHDIFLVFESGYNLDSFQLFFTQTASADHVEAEDSTELSGSLAVETKSTGVTCLGYIDTGDWARYAGLDFGTGADTFHAQIASRTTTSHGTIAVHLDSLANPPVAVLTGISGPGGWENFGPASTALAQVVAGVHDVYLVFENGYNLDSFGFDLQ